MRETSWCFRHFSLWRDETVYVWEECSHGVAFVRACDGRSRGAICLDHHEIEWFESCVEKEPDDWEVNSQLYVRGEPVPARLILLALSVLDPRA
jgi:hypothetical protein